MKKIPTGFKKMGVELTFKHDQIKIWEEKILYFLVRDYYIFYTKTPKFDGETYTRLNFWCRPKDESSITYRMACYAQCLFGHYNKKGFINPIHSVPTDFPKCIHIDLTQDEVDEVE